MNLVEPLDLVASLVLEDGRLWGDVAAEFQREDAKAILDPSRPRWHFLTRPRGGSKSTDLAAVLLAWLVCLARPGEKAHIAATDLDQSRFAVLDALTGFIGRTPSLRAYVKVQADKVIAIETGASVEVLAMDAPSAHGLRSSFVVADEVAQWPSTRSPRKMWAALVSSLGKIDGCRFACITSAGDPSSWSFEVLKKARRSRHWRTNEVPGPLEWIDPDSLEAQRPLLLDSEFAQYHLNQWIEDESRLVSEADLEAAAILDGPLQPVPGRRYIVACDLGLVNDASVGIVAHVESDARVVVVDRVARWKGSKRSPVSITEDVEPWLVERSREFNRARIIIDSWQAAGTVERLSAMQIRADEIRLSEPAVGRIGTTLHLAFREHRVHIPNDEELLAELRTVRLRRTNLGEFRLDHDSGNHDDHAMAIGLAVVELAPPPRVAGPVLYTESELKSEDFRVALEAAHARGEIPQPAALGHRFAGDFAMPASITAFREDDQSQNGKTQASPFV